MSFEIHFEKLFIPGGPENPTDRLALSVLDEDENSHIHGGLQIVVGGRSLPDLGFFGPDDVCFNDWASVLFEAGKNLKSNGATYVFDEGEQGQPAYEFQRSEGEVLVSVIDSEVDGIGNPDWQRVSCELEEFITAIDQFIPDLKRSIEKVAGAMLTQRWFKQIGVAT